MTSIRCFSSLRISLVTWVVIWLLAVPASALASHPWQQWADDFGLDLNVSYDGVRIMTMAMGEFEITEHKAPQKMYTEFNMGNISGATILREDLDKAYTIMPSMGMYREMSLSDGMFEAGGGMQFSDISVVGEEDINGHPSTKYRTRFVDKEGKGAGFIWVTDSGVPIKMDMVYSTEDEQGMRISSELVELNLREQDPQIFELPEGLNPMMGGLSGLTGMPGMPQAGDPATTAMAEEMLIQMAPGGPLGSAAAETGLESIGGLEGLKGLIPGMAQEDPQAAPAGSGGGAAVQSNSMSKQLTTDNLTQSVQYHLQYLGIDPGNTSGEISLDTQIAISEYQASKGMKVTGEVSPQLLGILSADVDSQ